MDGPRGLMRTDKDGEGLCGVKSQGNCPGVLCLGSVSPLLIFARLLGHMKTAFGLVQTRGGSVQRPL